MRNSELKQATQYHLGHNFLRIEPARFINHNKLASPA